MPDFVGPEFEIMMHRHQFEFREVCLPLRKGVDVMEGSSRAVLLASMSRNKWGRASGLVQS
jgi:hypothetical protein